MKPRKSAAPRRHLPEGWEQELAIRQRDAKLQKAARAVAALKRVEGASDSHD